ncbi:MAG TPA: hypothetical protein VKD91_10545, partial [Pyrinomonadaceae bacterium]|nr:hypothetical protein [Pyrinomonadaceae bacterium]
IAATGGRIATMFSFPIPGTGASIATATGGLTAAMFGAPGTAGGSVSPLNTGTCVSTAATTLIDLEGVQVTGGAALAGESTARCHVTFNQQQWWNEIWLLDTPQTRS